jgi:uncharacterized protein
MKKLALVLALYAAAACQPASAGVTEGLAAYKNKDYATALRELLPAARSGNIQAQQKLWFMYANGEGVLRNVDEAARWLRMAAEAGDVTSQRELGAAYINGHRGVMRDEIEALKWYRAAALQGDLAAQRYLGLAYEEGNGIPQDLHESKKWYRIAANRGDALAQYKLGVEFAKGNGVRKSAVVAYALWSLSATTDPSPSNRAVKGRTVMAANMSEQEIADAEALALNMAEPGKLLSVLDTFVK